MTCADVRRAHALLGYYEGGRYGAICIRCSNHRGNLSSQCAIGIHPFAAEALVKI